MMRIPAFRGQPILLLLGLLCGWGALRVAFWENPIASGLEPGRIIARVSAPLPSIRLAQTVESVLRPAPPGGGAQIRFALPPAIRIPVPAAGTALPDGAGVPVAPPPAAGIAGSPLLFASGLAQMEVAPELLAQFGGPAARPFPSGTADRAPPAPSHAPPPNRLTGDGWVLLRPDAAGPLRPGAPAYGRSQAGAVLRYRLGNGTDRSWQAHMRASAALSGAEEREVAAGISARPIAAVPLRLTGEMRLAQTGAGNDVRPAAHATSEITPISLPLGARAEAYLQAGYVGGDFATFFADGQMRVDRPAARLGGAELIAGMAAWGGAQKGAARLDVGPSGAMSFNLGDMRARIAADYRIRLAGDARPASGPALTLSAGF